MRVPSSLADVKAEAAKILHWPENMGVEFRTLQVATEPETEALAIFIPGLADEQLVRTVLIDPLINLGRHGGSLPALTPEELMRRLPAPRLSMAADVAAAVKGVMEGDTAVFLPGGGSAVLVKTGGTPPADQIRGPFTWQPRFESQLSQNIVLIRKRLQDPGLIAMPLDLPDTRASSAALVYIEGRVSPDLLSRVQAHLRTRAGEGAFRQGLAAGLRSKWGLLPTFLTSVWPDKVAALIDSGHVAIIIDGVPQVFMAPVTVSACLYSPLDATLARPISLMLRVIRVVLACAAVTASGTVIALTNYHQEMMPTPFLFSFAVLREQAPLPMVMEILFLELIQEMVREAAYQWPWRLSPGNVLIAGKLLMLLLTQAGVVGTGTAAFSVVIMFSTLGYFGYELVFLLRPWRYLILAGGAVFGFFGMSTVLFLFLLYLMTAEFFGVPFVPESGLDLTGKNRQSVRRKGGDAGATPAGIR